LKLAQTLRQRAFKQRYKLDVSLSVVTNGEVELALRVEPSPRVHGLEVPASFGLIANALDRLGYVGEWDPYPGHAAANGTWRRALPELAAAHEELAFVQGLGAAMDDAARRRPMASARAALARNSGDHLNSWPLVDALRSKCIGGLSPMASDFERTASVEIEGRRCMVKLQISFLGGTMYKSARSASDAAVRAVMGRAKGEWLPAQTETRAEPSYMVFAPLRNLDAAARFVGGASAFV
jgi:hypothetical protein